MPALNEWILQTKLMPANLGARDLPERICANVTDAGLVPTDPSRERSQVSILFTKPIPLAQLFDSKAIALDDTTKERSMETTPQDDGFNTVVKAMPPELHWDAASRVGKI